MCCSRLFILEGLLSHEEIKKLEYYYSALTPNLINSITVSKVSKALNIESEIATKALLKCKESGILTITYGIRCPECGTLIKRVEKLSDIPKSLISCYSCNTDEIEITNDDIEVLFSLVEPLVFNGGQQDIDCDVALTNHVAQEDTLKNILLAGSVNEVLFSPTEEEFQELDEMYQTIFEPSPTTKATGDMLERLTAYLFNLSPAFKAASIKTTTNQIDCYVRNTIPINSTLFNAMGGRFLIECKNEAKTPKGDYMSKLHSIICNINGKKSLVTFGIIISKCKGPSTFRSLANKMYLSKSIIIISICGEEIKELIDSRGNLLELLERKIDEVITEATTDMKAVGLFSD